MKPKFLFTSFICLGLMGATALSTFVKPQYEQASAATQTVTPENFVYVNDFLNSGLGIQIEFDYVVPKTQKTNIFNFLTANWFRLTDGLTMTFKSNGSVTCNIGKVFKVKDHYYYQVMCSDLAASLNSVEGATGQETIGMMYINQCNVKLNIYSVTTIESEINAYEKVVIRDENRTGLKYRAYIPSVNPSSTYGMIITPNYYVAKYVGDYITHLQSDNHQYINLVCNPVEITTPENELYKVFGRGYQIQGSITNILEDNYQVPFSMIPYERLSNGTYKYGNFSKNTKYSLYDVCSSEKENDLYNSRSEHAKEYIDYVINKCEVHPTIKTSTSNVTAYFAYNTQQVLKTDPLPEAYDTTVSIEGSRNETQTAQLILNVKNNLHNKYYVNLEPFVHEDGNYRISQKEVEISKQLYQNVESNWRDLSQFNMAWYHNQREDPVLGWWPDALLPFDLAIDSGENYLDTVNGENNGLFIRMKIPADAVPGLYTSKIVIRIIGEDTLVVPVRLSVYNINLPNENHSKYTIFVNKSELAYTYGEACAQAEGQHYKSAFELLADRGIGGALPAESWKKDDLPEYIECMKKYAADDRIASYFYPFACHSVTCDISFKYTERRKTKTKTISFNNTAILSAKDYLYEDDPSIMMYGYETLFEEMAKASTNELNLFKKAVMYFPYADEPGTSSVDQLQNVICENVFKKSAATVLRNTALFEGKEEVKKSLEHAVYVCTSCPRGILKGLADNDSSSLIEEFTSINYKSDNCKYCYLNSVDEIEQTCLYGFCPQYDCFDYFDNGNNKQGYQDLMNYLQDPETYNVWWYGCCMPVPPYAVNWVNSPIVRMRANKWYQYKAGIQGELYYMCNRGSQFTGNAYDGTEMSIPKNEDQILAGACTYNGIYGDGQYIYPVHDMYKNIDSSVFWLSSLRLENLGQANNDYNYLYYADELISMLPESEQAEAKNRLNVIINSVTTGPFYNTTNHALLLQKKNELANFISSLERTLG